MEKIFTELYKDIHNSVQAQQDPFKKFLFSTRQHVLIIFYFTIIFMRLSFHEYVAHLSQNLS